MLERMQYWAQCFWRKTTWMGRVVEEMKSVAFLHCQKEGMCIRHQNCFITKHFCILSINSLFFKNRIFNVTTSKYQFVEKFLGGTNRHVSYFLTILLKHLLAKKLFALVFFFLYPLIFLSFTGTVFSAFLKIQI